MAIEVVETASSAGDSSTSSGGSGGASGNSNTNNLGASSTAGAFDDFALLDDWATGEQDHIMLSGEADDNATAMWNMDSIDVASCFAGESSYVSHAASATSTHGLSVTGQDVAAAIAEADPLFDASLTHWWDQSIDISDTGVPLETKSASSAVAATVGSTYPTMAPLKLGAGTAAEVPANFMVPDKEVTDALLAVFAPHTVELSDDSLTDSGTESSSMVIGDRGLSHAASPASSVSSSSSYAFGSSGTDAPVLVSQGTSRTSSSASASARPPLPRQASATASGKKKAKAKSKGAAAESAASLRQELADDEKDLTPLEIRRKRNRESMQRARRRQRDDVEEMKETLHELELHYQKLSDAAQERRGKMAGASSAASSALTAAPTQHARREADYYAAADLSHTLKEEKFLLEQMLMEKQKTYRRMQQVMVDRVQELALPCPTTTKPEFLFTDFEFSPITEEQSNELIRQCYLSILQFQDAATPLTPPRGMKAEHHKPKPSRAEGTLVTSQPFPPPATFGWKVSCHVTQDQNFFVSFAKYFRGVSAEEAMLNTWTRTLNPHVDRSPHRRLVQYQVLQVINDSTYVAGMDIHHPVKKGKQMRNTFCRFRLQTDEGVYVIGRASMNPKSPELRRQAEEHATFEYVDNYSWIEFSSVVDKETGEDGVWVKFNARTEYNTQEDSHLRLVNSLYLTLKWESAVIPNTKPGFFLSSSSS